MIDNNRIGAIEQIAKKTNKTVNEVLEKVAKDKNLYESYVDLDDAFIIKKHQNLGYYPHFHEALEIYYVLKGEMNVIIGGNKCVLRENEMSLANSFEIHSYDKSVDTEVLVFIVSSKYLLNFYMEYPEKSFENFLRDKKNNLILLDKLKYIYDNKNELIELEKLGFTNIFLSKIIKIYGMVNKKQIDNNITKIVDYIYENYKNPISIASLAKEFNYAPMSISRIFRKSIGIDFRVFLNNVRAEKSEAMLQDKANANFNITQIATENGFNSISSFYRAYKRKYNRLPIKCSKSK